MIFKINHEKTDHLINLPEKMIRKMLNLAFPNTILISHNIISGGCANLNIKIILNDAPIPYILRVYIRDKDAAFREEKLGTLLKDIVPIPQIYFIGDYENYRFAIMSFLKGITLRDLLLSDRPHDIKSLMREAGFYLSKIRQIQFNKAGFFDKNLCIIPHDSEDAHYDYIKNCLIHPIVIKYIHPENHTKIIYYIDRYKAELSDLHEKNLVHGDYDPANILVDQIDNHWKITGILDWEFAYAGSTFQDIANMLRYAHFMPSIFEESFLHSLKENGMILPENWRIKIHLLNISALLDCFIRRPPEECPQQATDILALIDHIIMELDKIHA